MPRGMPVQEVLSEVIPDSYGNPGHADPDEENDGLVDGLAKGGTCPQGHQLREYVTTGGSCDVCATEVIRGAIVMDCRMCNWYSCKDCYNAMPKSTPAEPTAGMRRIRILVLLAVLFLLMIIAMGTMTGGGGVKQSDANRSSDYEEEEAEDADDKEIKASSHSHVLTKEETSAYHSENCNDAHGWKDSKGRSCADYETRNLCTHTGKQGVGWDASEGPMPSVAAAACCYCGGGSEDDHGDFAGGSTVVETKNVVTGEVELVVTPKAPVVPAQQPLGANGHPAVGSIGGPLSASGPPPCFLLDLSVGGIMRTIAAPGAQGDQFSVASYCDGRAEFSFEVQEKDQCVDPRHQAKHPVNIVMNQREAIVALAGCCSKVKPTVSNPRLGHHEECWKMGTYQKASQTYIFAEYGDSTCAGAGSSVIKTDAECQTAALSRGLRWVGTIDRSGRPAGCFTNNKVAGFNISPLGRMSSGQQRRICRKETGWKVMAGWVPPGMKIKMTKAKVKKAAAEYSQAQAQNPDHLEVVNPVAGGGSMTPVTPVGAR